MKQKSNLINIVFFLIIAVGFNGCQTLAGKPKPRVGETPQEIHKAVVAVSGAMVGHPLSEEEKKRLEQQILNDPQAQSAIKVITSSSVDGSAGGKYCPLGGEHYASSVDICPVHKVQLLSIND